MQSKMNFVYLFGRPTICPKNLISRFNSYFDIKVVKLKCKKVGVSWFPHMNHIIKSSELWIIKTAQTPPPHSLYNS